jgi:hypothetical protein
MLYFEIEELLHVSTRVHLGIQPARCSSAEVLVEYGISPCFLLPSPDGPHFERPLGCGSCNWALSSSRPQTAPRNPRSPQLESNTG